MSLVKKHILFIVPDGVGIKNYLYSGIIANLKKHANITIWSTLPIEAFSDVKRIHNIEFGFKQIKFSSENNKTRLYREATTYARLKHNSKIKNNPTILTNWRRPNYSIKVKLLYRLAEILGRYLSKKYDRIINYENKAIANISKNEINNYTDSLKELNPTSIFITHQRVAGLMPLCLAAKFLNIRIATAIFSWDNLPKARLAVKTDEYFVWSQWMKDEMKDYYPEIPQDKVKLVGTSQFEFYFDNNRIVSRSDFASRYGLDKSKKWICFSGDDITTSPYDNLFLKDVAKELYPERDNLQIIFRRCPVDFSTRYDDVIEKYKEFVVAIDPIWNIESETNWTGYFPKYEDIDMQINLAHHCELVVNLGSTMAIDFATFNKPCLYLNYNPSEDSTWSTEIIYKFQHFRSMKQLNAVGWINNSQEILELVLATLNNQKEIAPERKLWMENIVLHPLENNSVNIAKALL